MHLINLGASIAGGNGTRREHDFYPTPAEATAALAEHLGADLPRRIWEPACGDGALAKVLIGYGAQVIASDLIDRGYGCGGIDFLETRKAAADAIITNPPFALADRFIGHAQKLGVRFLALLLKVQFYNAAGRLPDFHGYRPAAVLPLTWRLDFTGGGRPTMDCQWVVWRDTATRTDFEPLRRPGWAGLV